LIEGDWRETDFDPITFGECGEVLTCQTEAFRRDKCNVSVRIEGTLLRAAGLDCYGRFYGNLPAGSLTEGDYYPYNRFRVEGSFVQNCETPVVETSDGGAILASYIEQTWLLRTGGLPEIVAKRIAGVIMSNDYTIDLEEMDVPGEICKNNDNGNLWYIASEFSRKTCESNPCN
jgi:hypothetical protein